MRSGLLLIVIALNLGACGFTGDAGDRSGNWLVMNNLAEPSHLDPALISAVEDQRINLALFEGLTSHDPHTLEPIPGVAERWEISPDGLRFRFFLRECFWSQGDLVRAQDFVYAWRRVLTVPGRELLTEAGESLPSYEVVGAYSDALYCIKGAKDFHQGKVDDFRSVGVRALDAKTLEVDLASPTPWFLELLCFPTFMPVHRPTVETHRESWTRPEHFVGNGAFHLAARRIGDSLTVARNPKYWDSENVGLDGIVYYSTDQVDTALDQYLAGESDWVRGFNPKKVRAWRKTPELSKALQAPEYLGTYFYRLNVNAAPLDDLSVRLALNFSLDRAAITEHLTGLGEEPARGIVPPCAGAFVPWQGLGEEGLGFDVERAQAYLAAAGYPEGKGFPKLTLAYNTDVKNKAIAEAAQQMWRKNLGIEVEILNREKRVHMSLERAGQYQISRGSWVGDYSDPTTFLEFLRSDATNNRTGWRDSEFDSLLAKSRALGPQDEALRLDYLQRAERRLILEGAPLIPIFYFRNPYLLRPDRFEGIQPNSRDLHPPKYIRMRSQD